MKKLSFSLRSGFAALTIVSVVPVSAYADEPSAPATTGVPATIVELSADDQRATIERRVGTTSPSGLPIIETGILNMGQWESACIAPCEVKLDPRYAYRVAGDGLVPTDAFGLPRSGDRVRVDAKMGSSTSRVAGALTTAGGLGAIALGGLALIATPILHGEELGSEGFRTGVLAGGIGAVSVGLVAVGIGTFLWFTNGSSAHAHTQVASR